MGESFEARERRKVRNAAYAKARWEKIQAEKAATAERERPDFKTTPNGIKSIAPPTLKVKELERMDRIVVEAYRRALEMGKVDEAAMIRNNPLNLGIEW